MATSKGGIGFCPNLATCDNTNDVLVIDPRPGNAASNDAAGNIAALDTAVSRLPGAFRRRPRNCCGSGCCMYLAA